MSGHVYGREYPVLVNALTDMRNNEQCALVGLSPRASYTEDPTRVPAAVRQCSESSIRACIWPYPATHSIMSGMHNPRVHSA